MPQIQPLVSYIITVKNGEKFIERTLIGVKNQTYKNIELIVVDNHSVDRTREIAKKYGARIYLKGPERSSQLKYGLKVSGGKYIFTTGCDLVADKDYIEQCVRKCEEKHIDAIYAHVVSEIKGYWSKVKAIERQCYINDTLHEASRFIKKETLIKIGGFDDRLILHGDDYEIQARLNKLGYKTGYINAIETHTDEIDSLKEIFLKSFYYGMNSLEYIKKYPQYAGKQLFPVRSAFLRNYKLILRQPILGVGLIIFKLVQYFAASIGLFLAILKMNNIGLFFHKVIYKKR